MVERMKPSVAKHMERTAIPRQYIERMLILEFVYPGIYTRALNKSSCASGCGVYPRVRNKSLCGSGCGVYPKALNKFPCAGGIDGERTGIV
jgi:hypothetical protein